jgi:hypothetical protein
LYLEQQPQQLQQPQEPQGQGKPLQLQPLPPSLTLEYGRRLLAWLEVPVVHLPQEQQSQLLLPYPLQVEPVVVVHLPLTQILQGVL